MIATNAINAAMNAINANNATNTLTQEEMQARNETNLAIYKDREAAALSANKGQKTITQRWKSPARSISVNVSAAPWEQLASEVPQQYASLLGAVLESAAKNIIKRHIEAHSVQPSTLPAAAFTMSAMLEEATNGNNDWMTKEELQQAWSASHTRATYISDPRYAASAAYRKAVHYYSELVLKLAGRSAAYEPNELDILVAKLREEDANTELGAFICRRVEQLRNKPQRDAAADLDLL